MKLVVIWGDYERGTVLGQYKDIFCEAEPNTNHHFACKAKPSNGKMATSFYELTHLINNLKYLFSKVSIPKEYTNFRKRNSPKTFTMQPETRVFEISQFSSRCSK